MAAVITLRSISKTFGGAHALRGVGLTVHSGEVHGLLGENGSGKSTLIKILAGFHAPEPGGELEVRGQPVRLPLQPGQFRHLGISFVHQDLGLIPSLSVVENLRIGEMASRARWHVSWATERRRAATVFDRYGVAIDPASVVADLSMVDRSLLAIVRAMEEMRSAREGGSGEEGLLVLDEATASLPREGVEKLFRLVREIAGAGSGVLLVSHHLNEVLEITDRVTVLRDGEVAGTVVTSEIDETRLVEMIIGRRLEKLTSHVEQARDVAVHTTVDGMTGGVVRDMSFDVREGEILGVTGLVGSGFEAIPYLLFGAQQADSGSLILRGTRYNLPDMQPQRAISIGIAMVPADRLTDGSLPNLSVSDNVSMQVIDRYAVLTKLSRSRLFSDSRLLLHKFSVKPPDPRAAFESLSGGNQQKVVLAKWIQSNPELLVLHEPTVGVDVGARLQIFSLIKEATAAGTAVICASSDYEQLAELCDRVLIIAEGKVRRRLTGSDLTKERIAEQCLTSGPTGDHASSFLETEIAGTSAG